MVWQTAELGAGGRETKMKQGRSQHTWVHMLSLASRLFSTARNVQILILGGHTTQHVELSQPGTELTHPALGVRSLNHWTTTEVPNFHILKWLGKKYFVTSGNSNVSVHT